MILLLAPRSGLGALPLDAEQRVLGTSPVGFVQDMRVEQAAHLLRTTGLSLEAIARQVGYEHANTLRVLLRERTGETTRTLRGRSGRSGGNGQNGKTKPVVLPVPNRLGCHDRPRPGRSRTIEP